MGWMIDRSHRYPVSGVAVSREQAPGATEWQSSQLAICALLAETFGLPCLSGTPRSVLLSILMSALQAATIGMIVLKACRIRDGLSKG
jgi:hypothetical protein